MKYCGTCKTYKYESEFGARKASIDGFAHKCKICQKEYDKARLRDPKRMKARLEYQKTKGKDKHNAATRKWVANNTIKRAAHILVGNAIRDGMLVKKNCEKCNSEKSNAHHDDYAKPLDVIWLCDDHHKIWHKENGEGLNAR
jgi:hypothetical protein